MCGGAAGKALLFREACLLRDEGIFAEGVCVAFWFGSVLADVTARVVC